MERVLFAVAHDAQPTVEDPEVRIQRGADPEVELAVVLIAVEPVAVVRIPVAGGRLRDRLRRLVDRIVVELAQHGSSQTRGGLNFAGDVTVAWPPIEQLAPGIAASTG